jgi:hypothetical protein
VRFEITAPPLLTMACHCTGCQRMSASALSLSVAISTAGFAVTSGEQVIGGLHNPDLRHKFCPHCPSWMFTQPKGAPFVSVRATLLDDTTGLAPFIETYTSEKLPWATTPAAHSFAKFPALEDYMALTQAFVAARD